VTDNEGATDLLDASLVIEIANEPPEIAIDNCPSPDLNGVSYNFEWTASDDSDDPSGMEYNVALDGSWQGWQPGLTEYLWELIPSGSREFRVKVRDNGTPQLEAEAVCNFNVNLGPSITINNCPVVDVNTSSYTFNWDVTDDNDTWDTLDYNVSKDGAWQGWQAGLANYQWNGLTSGPHTFKVKVRDSGNPALESSESTCSFDVNFQPSVEIDLCPVDIVQYDTYTFDWTGTDDLSSEASMDYSWKLDSGSWSAWQTGLLTIELLDLSNDIHTFRVRVRDTGNPQLTCEIVPATCDSCVFEIDTSCSIPPPNVTGFSASDGDPSLNVREARLTWDLIDVCVDFYDIEERIWTESGGWHWVAKQTLSGTQDTWLDTDARYSGTANPIEYRIKARNVSGSSPSFATDTGYPRMRRVEMAIWCAADDDSGTNAVTPWSRALADLGDCNGFWNGFGINYVLKSPGGFLWMTTPAFRNLSGSEPDQMHNAYGLVQNPDSLDVYIVDTAYGSSSFAFAKSFCPGEVNTTENLYIIMSSDSRGTAPDVNHATLAHETGHTTSRLIDIYLLDSNWNFIYDDATTCADIQDFCNSPPSYMPPLFCDEDAFYPEEPNSFFKIPKQIMYYSFSGRPISDYDMYVSQWFWVDEWLSTYESNYPEP
jgi:hypothetical protein